MDADKVLVVLNSFGLILFTVLLGSGVFGVLRRAILYRRAKETLPVLIRRDVVLLSALATIGLETLALRALGVTQLDGWPRVAFVLQSDIILISALVYWVKVELWDIDDPNKS